MGTNYGRSSMLQRITVKDSLVEALEELCQALEFRDQNKLTQLFGDDSLQNMDEFRKAVEMLEVFDMDEVSWGKLADMLELADTSPPDPIRSESEESLCQVRAALAKIGEQMPEHKQDDSHQHVYLPMLTKVLHWLDNKIAAERLSKKRLSQCQPKK